MNTDAGGIPTKPRQSALAAVLLCSLAFSLPERDVKSAAAATPATARLACANAISNQGVTGADRADLIRHICSGELKPEGKAHL